MPEEEKEKEKPTAKLLIILVSAVLAGAGGNLSLRVIDNPRPDPFTGADGKQLEAKILWRMERLEKAVEESMTHIHEHEKESESWKRRIILLEARLK